MALSPAVLGDERLKPGAYVLRGDRNLYQVIGVRGKEVDLLNVRSDYLFPVPITEVVDDTAHPDDTYTLVKTAAASQEDQILTTREFELR